MPTLTTLVPSTKAYKRREFLTSSAARHIRIMCELQEPAQRLGTYGVDNTLIMVGSHVVMHPDDRAEELRNLEQMEKELSDAGKLVEMEAAKSQIENHQRLGKLDKFYVIARELAQKLAKWNKARRAENAGHPSYHIGSGGGPGIMEAANRGAQEAGELTVAFGSSRAEWPTISNPYTSEQTSFTFHYFFMQKYWTVMKCEGLVVFPGGLGSLDQLFEILVLVTSKRTHPMPVILVGSDFWKRAVNWEYLVETGVISGRVVGLLSFLDTAEEIFQALVEGVTKAETSGRIAGTKRELPQKATLRTSSGDYLNMRTGAL